MNERGYTTSGPVRGACGHRHRTLSGAIRCLDEDSAGCKRQGGYTDRSIRRVDGKALTDDELDFIMSEGW